MLEHMLTADGHRVTVARDGREALALVARDRPDLILTDLDMPHMNGYEVCRRIKKEPATRLLPVLMITGRLAEEARVRAWELGADDFLTKPLDTVEVTARCRSLLRVKRLVDELDSAEAVVFAFARAVEAKCRYTWVLRFGAGPATRSLGNRENWCCGGAACFTTSERSTYPIPS